MVIGFGAAFLIAGFLGMLIIPILIRFKFGQEIREIGPSWHQKKSGTPTMGGILFIGAFLIVTPFFIRDIGSGCVAVCAVLFGLIGFSDDFIKIARKRNLGLTAKQKFLSQLFITVAFVLVLLYTGEIGTEIFVPLWNRSLDLGFLFIPFAVFVILGVVNGVNLTDGIDGLAGSVTLIVSVFLAVAATYKYEGSLAATSLILAGGLLGFLLYNLHPAKVFMGDTGSLFLGGYIAAVSVLLGFELILLFCGIIYLVETLSVIIQVVSYKLTGKRVFKMSPIHHHFEMCGWKENKIVLAFSSATVLFCIISYFLIR